jgi:D-3-phosphoglycerate dehydrogenase
MLGANRATSVAVVHAASRTRATLPAIQFISVRTFADVDIEHGRKEWKILGDLKNYKPGKNVIKTFNKISPIGLGRFPTERYEVRLQDEEAPSAHAILLRSHKLKEEEVPPTVRAIARCGAGTNNVPVARMTELGIPVFNTPGANANAVKELVLCGLLLGSRRVVDGINHMKDLGNQGLARERVEKDKAMFGGREIKGKTLAVIGLGHIGSMTARDAAELGMNLQGYDPGLSVQSALKLPTSISLCDSIAAAVAGADYISINIPYIKGEGGTHGIIGKDVIENFKADAVLLNFARGELVDSEAMKVFLDSGNGRYVSDFPDDLLWDHKNAVILPHLGASTEEAEDAAASMAADTIRDFLQTGAIRNSVNFPTCSLGECSGSTVRITVVNLNVPGCLAKITDAVASENFNIVQQINQSRGNIAYSVLDIDTEGHNAVADFKSVQEKITMLEGVLCSRIIYEGKTPGTGFAKNLEGEYFV